MRVCITGINGHVGSWLAEFYLKKGYEVHGIVRPRSNLTFLQGLEGLKLHLCDIRDAHGVMEVLKNEFNIIHHLAAITFVPYSWENPSDTIETNVLGSVNVLEAVRRSFHSDDAILHVAGSSEEYGYVKPDEVPITENNPLRPHSPYGVSKVAEDMLAQQYYRSYGLKTVVTRAFNHTSIRRGDHFLTKQVVIQAARIKKGLQEHFILGNLEAVRDFLDVRDVLQAYFLAVEKCNYGEPYNVSSGIGLSAREVVDIVAGIAKIPNKAVEDPSRVRPSEAPILIGDSTKFREKTGWRPTIPIEETLSQMYEYELSKA